MLLPAIAQNAGGLGQNTPSLSQSTGGLSQNTTGLSQNTRSSSRIAGGLSQNPGGLSQNTSGFSQNTLAPATAQNPASALNNGSLSMTLGVDQRFVAGDNLALSTPSDGSSAFSETRMSFDLSRITSTDQLDFVFGGAFRVGNVPTNVPTDFVNPFVGIDYSRIGGNALFSFGVDFQETDVAFNRSLSSYTDQNGRLVLPPDFGNFGTSGTRQVYGFNTSFQTGINDPFGIIFDADYIATSYQNSTSSDFEDFGLGASAVFRPNQITDLFIDYDYRRFIDDGPGNLDSVTNSISLRGVRSVSQTTDVTASYGISDVETEDFGITTSQSNPIASIGMTRQMANGTADVLLDITNSRDGRRATLVYGRSLTLPVDTISYSLGVTDGEGFGANVIGGLNWQRVLPTGRVFANINRDITTNNRDEERLATTVSLGYQHDFTTVSSVLLNVRYGESDFDNTTSDTTRSEVNATYRHTLTKDWNLDTGISYRIRNEQFIDSEDSTSLFLSLNRNFDWLR
ncbi:MAG: hypothetical protein ABJV68_30570 [Paracoccaceae bacterium]